MPWFSDRVVSELQGALDRTFLRQKLNAQNIANADTPNYKAKRVVFADEFKSHLKAYKTDPRHLDFSTNSGNRARILTESGTSFNHNGNNVDMDREMTEIAKNQIRYQALVARLNHEFSQLKLVLRGGN
ncbi:MAG TPA: flagellar basal body rod protein FlgB [Bacillales bacterium]|nr:flagellar basal body rod protein FlgB [Bacillales bacterium]